MAGSCLTCCTSLYTILPSTQEGCTWEWGSDQQQAFQASKDMLTSDKFLAHFDPIVQLTLACDGSGYGLGAVLTPKMAGGSDN